MASATYPSRGYERITTIIMAVLVASTSMGCTNAKLEKLEATAQPPEPGAEVANSTVEVVSLDELTDDFDRSVFAMVQHDAGGGDQLTRSSMEVYRNNVLALAAEYDEEQDVIVKQLETTNGALFRLGTDYRCIDMIHMLRRCRRINANVSFEDVLTRYEVLRLETHADHKKAEFLIDTWTSGLPFPESLEQVFSKSARRANQED